MTPGLTLKFLRNNVQSANMFALVSLEGINTDEFFSHNFSNGLAYPNMNLELQVLFEKFTQASNCPLMVGGSELALYDFDGKKYDEPKFPFQLIFKPLVKIGNCSYNEGTLRNLFTSANLQNQTIIEV